ncbi:MAG: putative toxin-antitoxin system toxin component, PIN family [Saprospiraceae bacterium]|jgi:putative PIN family toxin of toxin-antitoxin system|nr:putative toxin-antitoxin system toxin component, PIN family [Saprospiraceae bacterium]
MYRVVLDTNVIVRAVSGRSFASYVFDALFKQGFTLCVSTEILLEYEEKLAEIYDKEIADLVISALILLPNVEHVSIYFDMRLIDSDADDDKFVNCVFAANADYLVSDDRHFRVLPTIAFPKITCLTYIEFKRLLFESITNQ